MDVELGHRGLLLESQVGQDEVQPRCLKVVDPGRLFLSE